jgi:hypothetical protein
VSAIGLLNGSEEERAMAFEDFEDFRERVHAERSVRAQRDAAERQIPGERLSREIREAFENEGSREPLSDGPAETPDGPSLPASDQE